MPEYETRDHVCPCGETFEQRRGREGAVAFWAPGRCPACMERYEAERRAEEENRAAEIMPARLVASGLPLPYRRREKTLATFIVEPEKDRAALDACRDLLEATNPQPLLITGGVGTGKTHLAAGTLAEAIATQRVPGGSFTTHQDILFRIRSTYNRENADTELGVINEYRRAPFLVLDDVGVERASAHAVSTLYAIVNYRYEERLPTIVTSNLSPNQLAAHLALDAADRTQAQRIVDRIVEGGAWFDLDGPSHRGK